MKVRKEGIEITIDKKDWLKYKSSGWVKKQEVRPELIRKRYLEKKLKGSNKYVSNGE